MLTTEINILTHGKNTNSLNTCLWFGFTIGRSKNIQNNVKPHDYIRFSQQILKNG